MSQHEELKRLADELIAANDLFNESPQDSEVGDAWSLANDLFTVAASPEVILVLIAENEALKGPHDWLAEDLIKELVDNAQSFQENSDHGDNDPFAIVLLAAASRIRRQESNLDQLNAENEALRKAAGEVLSWIEAKHRPPVADQVEHGRMALVRLHALAELDAAMGKGEQS